MEFHLEDQFKELVALLTKEKLIKSIHFIHYKLPELFTNENKQELIKLISSLKIKTISKLPKTKFKIQQKINKEYLKTKIYNKGIIITKKPKLDSKDRCQARVWGNAHLSLDSNKKIIYGSQCSFKKYKHNHYCQKHLIKNKHGNFNQDPPLQIIKEYLHYNPKFQKNILDNCKEDESAT
tara:strand:+ start:264 stop:803 length:540 start_codon:yes stop_codon:yes gene_type:complete